jgi:hypothetical protein
MPGYNGTGPNGLGPKTGWGRGPCEQTDNGVTRAANQDYGYGSMRYGQSRGRGRGDGHGVSWRRRLRFGRGKDRPGKRGWRSIWSFFDDDSADPIAQEKKESQKSRMETLEAEFVRLKDRLLDISKHSPRTD